MDPSPTPLRHIVIGLSERSAETSYNQAGIRTPDNSVTLRDSVSANKSSLTLLIYLFY